MKGRVISSIIISIHKPHNKRKEKENKKHQHGKRKTTQTNTKKHHKEFVVL